MSLSARGSNEYIQLGIKNTLYSSDTDSPTPIPFDVQGIQCISSGENHSVIIKDFHVFAAGSDKNFKIGGDTRQTYEKFTEVKICEEQISWAACGKNFTLYLTTNGKVILCHQEAIGKRIQVKLAKKAVSVFAGAENGGIIDEEGAVLILDKKYPYKIPKRFSLGAPAVDITCCYHYVCALTSDGRVFINKYHGNEHRQLLETFSIVSSLKGVKVEKLSGYSVSCAALTSDGRVFTYGMNFYGQLGDGSNDDNLDSFTEIIFNEEIKDVSCSEHTLFLTKSSKVYGCGKNAQHQLFKNKDDYIDYVPSQLRHIVADQVFACHQHSFFLTGTSKLENPAKEFFKNYRVQDVREEISPDNILLDSIEKQRKQIEEQKETINSILSICQSQSQTISQLMEVCLNFQTLNESRSRDMNEMREVINRQNDEMNRKIETLVRCISDQDNY